MSIRSKRLNNQGATLVITIISLAALLMLVSMMLSLAVTNYRNKGTDYKSRQEFYSAEIAANEVYSGMGTNSLDILGKAYAKTLENVAVSNLTGSIIYTDSSTLNTEFKAMYMIDVVKFVLDKSITKADLTADIDFTADADYDTMKANALDVIRKYVSKGDNTVISFASANPGIVFDKAKYLLRVEDIHISYTDGEFQSNETFDLEIRFPDWSFAFTSNSDLGNPYINYSMIGRTGVKIGMTGNRMVNENGGIYGGYNAALKGVDPTYVGGIYINTSNANINADKGAIVADGDVTLRAAAVSTTSLNFTGATTRVFCNNILVVPGGSANQDKTATLTLGAGTKAYCADDLQIGGNNTVTTINGDLLGFGAKIDEGEADKSSAIIVNGKGNHLTANGNVTLAGKAYINVYPDHKTMYTTGESIAVKSDQMAYLIPTEWLQAGKSNPSSTNYALNEVLDMSKVPVSLYNPADPTNSIIKPTVLQRQSSTAMYYYYFAFNGDANATLFASNAANGAYGAEIKAAVNKSLQELITKNADDSIKNSTVVSINGTSNTTGAVASADGSSVTVTGATGVSLSTVKDAESRYRIEKSILQNIDEAYTVFDPQSPGGGFSYKMMNLSMDPLSNHIDLSTFRSATYNNFELPAGVVSKDGIDYEYYVRYVVLSNPTTEYYKIDNTVPNKNLVIVVDGNVKVERSFTGMVIATGEILVDADVTINANPDAVDAILSGTTAGQIFEHYKTSATVTDKSIGNIDYTDVVGLTNWRKN